MAHAGKVSRCSEPQAIRQRIDESYDDKIELLQEEMGKRKKDHSVATLQSIMEDTFTERCRWIQDVQPALSDILDKFLPLKLRKVVFLTCTYNTYNAV